MPAYPQMEVNGLSLNHPAGLWAIAPDQPLRTLPGRRASTVTVPGRGGVTVPRRTIREPSTFTVSLYAMGQGNTNAARVASLENTLNVLDWMFSHNGELFPVTYIKGPAASDRLVAMCRRIASTDPQRLGNGDSASVSFVLEIPSGTWRSANYTIENPAVAGPGSLIYINGLQNSIREVDDMQFLMRGPFGPIRFTNPHNGQWLHLDRGANANEYIRIDVGDFRARVLGSPDFLTENGADISQQVLNGGTGANFSWLTLFPDLNWSNLNLSVALQVNGLNNLAIRSRGSF